MTLLKFMAGSKLVRSQRPPPFFTHFPQAPFDQNHPSNSWGAKLERFFDRGFKTPALHLLESLRGLGAAGKVRAVFTHNLRELGAAICACWG